MPVQANAPRPPGMCLYIVDCDTPTRSATSATLMPLDVVVDWAGVPRSTIKTQKGQAILLTLAANSVLINRRSDDYWVIQRRWIDGEHKQVVAERKVQLDGRMGRSG